MVHVVKGTVDAQRKHSSDIEQCLDSCKEKWLNRNWCGKLTLFLPFSRCFTGSYFKIKKVPFFILNTIVKILIS